MTRGLGATRVLLVFLGVLNRLAVPLTIRYGCGSRSGASFRRALVETGFLPRRTRLVPPKSSDDGASDLPTLLVNPEVPLIQEGLGEVQGSDTGGASPTIPGNAVATPPSKGFKCYLDELVAACTEATTGPGAMESPHTGSSEWAGFRTTKELLEVRSLRVS